MAESLIIRTETGAALWEIVASAGTRVAGGAPILILESMRMEIPGAAPRGATVPEILVEEGQQVEEGQPVTTLAP